MKGFGVGKHKKKYQFTARDVADILKLKVETVNKHNRDGIVDLDNLASVVEYIIDRTR